MNKAYNLITVLGPTAVGKTRLSARLADYFNGEIISADSRQVYKYMDIGTGKDLEDYQIENKEIKYHLINVLHPKEEFNLFLFKEMFGKAFADIQRREKTHFLVGGTGLYLNSILQDYALLKVNFDERRAKELNQFSIDELRERLKKLNPNPHNTTDLLIKERIAAAIMIAEQNNSDKKMPRNEIKSLTIGIYNSRENIKKNITARLKARLEAGMIDEVKRLIEMGITFEKLNFFGLEYKFISQYLKGELNYNDMYQKLNSAIHNFAKRQMTWFRKMEREGVKIFWINGADIESATQIIEENYYGKISHP